MATSTKEAVQEETATASFYRLILGGAVLSMIMITHCV